jgi:diaminopimelate epimerase
VLRFVKMHGLGNDYIYLDGVSTHLDDGVVDWCALARQMSDRHVGVGSDGIIMLAPVKGDVRAHVRMRMWNADGSEGSMCGNGVRCVAAFARGRLGMMESPLVVQVGREDVGLRCVEIVAESAGSEAMYRVDMGRPKGLEVGERAVVELDGIRLEGELVSMGNPHAVMFAWPAEMSGEEAARVLGPRLEGHQVFGQRVNVHFVHVESRGHARMWTWERGSGITQACGTGACSVLVAGVRRGVMERAARIDLPGGRLEVAWASDEASVMMTGPATEVYAGIWPHRLPRIGDTKGTP